MASLRYTSASIDLPPKTLPSSGASTPSTESSSSSCSSYTSTSSPSSTCSTSTMHQSDTSSSSAGHPTSSFSTPVRDPTHASYTNPPDSDTMQVPRTDPHRVLLLLDIQHAMLSPPPVGIPNAPQVYKQLETLLSLARSAPHPKPLIIHVRNAGDAGDPDEPNSPGWALLFPPTQEQLDHREEIIVDKRKNNAFAGTNLGEEVPVHAEIVVAGFQTDYSIRATCSAALGRGNEVVLIKGAHATYDRIEVLHGGGITPAHRIEAEIEAELEEAGVHLLEMKDVPGLFVGR